MKAVKDIQVTGYGLQVTGYRLRVTGYRLWVMVLLAVLPIVANAVAYQNMYQPTGSDRQRTAMLAEAPTAVFLSTSTLAGSGSAYSATPMLGADGTVSAPGCGPRRAKMEDPDPFGGQTIGGTTNPTEPGTPIGDGTWILMLMAMMFGLFIAMKRKKVGSKE